MSDLFSQPDYEKDDRAVRDEQRRSKASAWKDIFWTPKEGDENLIRILPARAGSGATYHLTAGKHFIKHGPEDWELLVCMKETYGKRCLCCEKFFELWKAGEKKAASRYRVRRVGVFNIIDRSVENPSVKLYEAPRTAVWAEIVGLVAGRGRMSDIFDEFDEEGNIVKPGRDILIIYKPKAEPSAMYSVYPTDPTPLGTKEEIEKWHSQIIDLLPEEIYPPIEEDVARIKLFGTKAEREELRTKTISKNSGERKETEAEKEKEEEKEAKAEGEKEKESEDEVPFDIPPEKEKEGGTKEEEEESIEVLRAKLKAKEEEEARLKAALAEKEKEEKKKEKEEQEKKKEKKQEKEQEKEKEKEEKVKEEKEEKEEKEKPESSSEKPDPMAAIRAKVDRIRAKHSK